MGLMREPGHPGVPQPGCPIPTGEMNARVHVQMEGWRGVGVIVPASARSDFDSNLSPTYRFFDTNTHG